MPADPVDQIHIAGPEVQVGKRLRQRCSWCGALLLDYDLTRISMRVDQEAHKTPCGDDGPSMFAPGVLVKLIGTNPRTAIMVKPEGDEDDPKLPDGACGLVDDSVTA